MILIFSRTTEPATAEVITWLNYLGGDWFRINTILDEGGGDEKTLLTYELENNGPRLTMTKQNKTITNQDVNVVWYRRLHHQNTLSDIFPGFDFDSFTKLVAFRQSERLGLYHTLFKTLKNKTWLSHPDTAALNKLLQLEMATSFGITVPDSYIVSDIRQLKNILLKHKKLAIKPVKDLKAMSFQGKFYNQYTQVIEMDFLNEVQEVEFPLYVQQYIEKEYEVRTFFIEDQFYSMAILSQENARTEVDFRRVDHENPNRTVPYKLPNWYEERLAVLMRELNLNTGSIDIMVMDGEYFFLEVNPVGQFGMVSYPCNYRLHKKVAEFLIENDKPKEI